MNKTPVANATLQTIRNAVRLTIPHQAWLGNKIAKTHSLLRTLNKTNRIPAQTGLDLLVRPCVKIDLNLSFRDFYGK